MITRSQLKEKFLDKGYDWEFDLLIGNIPNPDFSRLLISPGELTEISGGIVVITPYNRSERKVTIN